LTIALEYNILYFYCCNIATVFYKITLGLAATSGIWKFSNLPSMTNEKVHEPFTR